MNSCNNCGNQCSNIYQRALEKIKTDEKNCDNTTRMIGIVGPTGATGPQGIPGPTGPQGIPGPTGSSYQFSIGDVSILRPNEMAAVVQQTVGDHITLNFAIPQGATGPACPYKVDNAFLTTFNQGFPDTGLEIPANERLPIDMIEVDTSNICSLDTTNHTLQFNQVGNYRIEFIVSAYVPFLNATFNPKVDFVSIGFREVDDSVVYAGASEWTADELPHLLVGTGIFTVTNPSTQFELYNFSNRLIYLNSPDIRDLSLHSYFLNPVVTINIQYLGR